MEGFLSGFRLAPKPLKGVELTEVSYQEELQLPIKQVLVAVTTAQGLSGWLGQATEFLAHVGIKFEIALNNTDASAAPAGAETSKAVITALDLPKRIVFMVEAIGEFDFRFKVKGAKVLVNLVVRRAVAPAEAAAWQDSLEPVLANLDAYLKSAQK